jgi:TctA family transporter
MVLGALPGIGGKLGITLLIPFVFGMDPCAGAVFLVAMHAVVHTGGSIRASHRSAGDGPRPRHVCDGFPLARKGEAGRALGASLGASGVGGVIGRCSSASLAPVARPVVLAFGRRSSSFLAVLGHHVHRGHQRAELVKGIIVGCLGLMLSFVGMDPQTGIERFTLGSSFSGTGSTSRAPILAVFAVPRDDRARRAPAAASASRPSRRAIRSRSCSTACATCFRYFGLTVRTSLIGAVIGDDPGLGATSPRGLCYGHAAQTSKTPELFGHGAIEGVIAPETANNSKEGGALLPTLFFGIPGSSGWRS